MKLSYRGVRYDYNQPTLEVTEGEILGKYRGANWRCHTLQEVPVPQPSHSLKYRGVSYGKSASSAVPAHAAEAAMGQKLVAVPAALSMKEVDRMHRANLRRNLERRLQSAKARGDQRLVRLLEAESRQLAL